MKADRKRLKAEKLDLLSQMKQLYCTLEDKESELRDFIRNYEQKMRESDIAVKQVPSLIKQLPFMLNLLILSEYQTWPAVTLVPFVVACSRERRIRKRKVGNTSQSKGDVRTMHGVQNWGWHQESTDQKAWDRISWGKRQCSIQSLGRFEIEIVHLKLVHSSSVNFV